MSVPKNVVLSIKPEYAFQIMRGVKTIELRRKFPTDGIEGGLAIIYASSPAQEIVGYAYIHSVYKLPISLIWEKFSKDACVSKKFFSNYFQGLDEGFAIALHSPTQLEAPLNIRTLEEHYRFSAPQSYRYASQEIIEAIEI